MFKLNKRRRGNELKIKDIVNELLKEDQEAKFSVMGEEKFYIHVDEDPCCREKDIITFDTEDLDDEYYHKDCELVYESIYNIGNDGIAEIIPISEDISNNIIRNLSVEIISLFEHLLEEKDITIPNDDRIGDEDEARIYGEEYYNLEDNIYNLIQKYLKIKEEPKKKVTCPIFFEKEN